jgi:hypothetical protein
MAFHFNKQTALKIVNPLLGVSFVLQMVSGMLADDAGDWYDSVMEFHSINGWTMCALVVAHVALNWSWIKANILKRGAKNSA